MSEGSLYEGLTVDQLEKRRELQGWETAPVADFTTRVGQVKAGPYSIGSAHLPGLSKLVEELGECGQVAGKIMGHGGFGVHWDGSDLKVRLEEELGDLMAAMTFFASTNGLDLGAINARAAEKIGVFDQWHEEQGTPERGYARHVTDAAAVPTGGAGSKVL